MFIRLRRVQPRTRTRSGACTSDTYMRTAPTLTSADVNPSQDAWAALWLLLQVSLGSCPDTQVMTPASSPPSSRCLPFRVCQTLRFLLSQFCRTELSVFCQQFHLHLFPFDLRVCQTLNSRHPPRLLQFRVCQTLNPHQSILQDGP